MNKGKTKDWKFPLKRLVITPEATSRLSQSEVIEALWDHVCGIGFELEDDTGPFNEQALQQSGPLLSRHYAGNGTEFHVLTDFRRQVTTVSIDPQEEQP